MLSDNQTLIRAIKNDIQIKEIYGIVNDIQQIVFAFVDISFCFIPRLENTHADHLTKQTLLGHQNALVG